MALHFRPAQGYVGDVIPFHWKGEWHLFYLKASADRLAGEPLTWEHISSRDLLHWREWPTALPAGQPGQPDADGCWTGCALEAGGLFHIFYTGYSVSREPTRQTICHATSRDLAHWEKDPANPVLLPDERWYAPGDWRDPFVFWNEEEACWWMLICSRSPDGLHNHRGALALATSPDLVHWQVQPPLWQPDLFFSPECPDLFRAGGRSYLVYSNYARRFATFYRIGGSPRGPWTAPAADNRLDDRLFYAAKTAADERRRFAFGWIATLAGGVDGGTPEWGGDLGLPREITCLSDGSLAFSLPPEVTIAAGEPQPARLQALAGSWREAAGVLRGSRADGMAYAALAESVPESVLFEAEVTLAEGTGAAGIALGEYMLRLEARNGRVVLDGWPRAELRLDLPYGEPVSCRLVAADGIIEAFVADRLALTVRAYNLVGCRPLAFVEDGSATFSHLAIRPLEP